MSRLDEGRKTSNINWLYFAIFMVAVIVVAKIIISL